VFDRLPYPQSQNRKPLSEEDYAIYAEALSDLPPEVIDAACGKWMREGRFFPIPGDLRGLVKSANSAGLELEAKEAWDRWFAHVTSYYHPDLGWDRRAPQLDAITEHAGSAAGGAHWVQGCPESELQWARKRFIEAYLLAHKTGQVEHLLTRGEPKKILASLTATAPEKQLSPPRQFHQPALADPASTSAENLREADRELHQLKEELHPAASVTPPVDAVPTETEWQARKTRQLRGLAEALPNWREDHERKIRLCAQLRAEGFPERRIAKQLFPGCPPKEQLRLLEQFASIFRKEIETCAVAPLPSSASVGSEADSYV
jgi:hypothetical protein